MLIKGKAASGFVSAPDPGVWAIVAFGEDDGQAADAARAVLAAWAKKLGALDVTLLDEDAVRKDPALLFDALEAASLLGEPRAVRVRTSGDKIAAHIVAAILEAERKPERFAARLIVEAGALASKSKLRVAAEGAKRTAALQLFADTASDIGARIEAALAEAGAAIEPGARDAFIGALPGHRALANSEIEKLNLFAIGLNRPITREDVRALSATDLEQGSSEAIRAVLEGRIVDAHASLDRLEAAGTSGISLLRALQMDTLRMIDALTRLEAGDAQPGMKLRPPVWPSDWAAYKVMLAKWNARRLTRILARIYEAEVAAKQSAATGPVVTRMLLNDLAKAAKGPERS